jgi:ribosomal protein S14
MQCPTHIKKLEKIPEDEEEKKPCHICGRDSTLYCKSCKFTQCSNCRICNQRHGLIKIIELNV